MVQVELGKGKQEKHPGKNTQGALNLTLLSVMSQETSKPNESEHPMKNARVENVFAKNNHELFQAGKQAGLSSVK